MTSDPTAILECNSFCTLCVFYIYKNWIISVPKTCDRGESSYRYRFSQRTGDCDCKQLFTVLSDVNNLYKRLINSISVVGDANTCAEIGTDHVVWFTVPSGPMNHSVSDSLIYVFFEMITIINQTSRLAVRKGCRASAFTLGGTVRIWHYRWIRRSVNFIGDHTTSRTMAARLVLDLRHSI